MTYVPLQFGVEYLNSQNSGFWDSLYATNTETNPSLPSSHFAAYNRQGIARKLALHLDGAPDFWKRGRGFYEWLTAWSFSRVGISSYIRGRLGSHRLVEPYVSGPSRSTGSIQDLSP